MDQAIGAVAVALLSGMAPGGRVTVDRLHFDLAMERALRLEPETRAVMLKALSKARVR